MNERKTFTIIDEFDNEIEYDIILAFIWFKTKKNYIVYTDNTKNSEGKLNVYAAIYYPNDDTRLDPVETEEEWIEIGNRLSELNK